ncbi:MAG: Uma2 family endonuclease, partial [Cyanobacteria bacterium REEB444]|nr:Uma2 family endonuclease [Cyanobacteria bacterium REEB444]
DRRVKVPLYADSGILETWLVNLNEDCLEVYRGDEELILQKGDRITSLAFPDVVLAVTDILG